MRCFFISPIGEPQSAARENSDTVMKYIIEPVCTACNMEVIRADNEAHGDVITDRIFSHINDDELCIVDITGANPNVFFEAGYRAANKKPLVFIRREGEPIPFDISGIQVLDYSLNVAKVETSKAVLQSAISVKLKNAGNAKLPPSLALTRKQRALLDRLCEIYIERIQQGMKETDARRFGNTQTLMKDVDGYDFDELNQYIIELAREDYVEEEHADLMVMFFELTSKAVRYAESK